MTVVALFVKAIDDIRTWLQTQRQQIFEAPPPRTSAVPPVQLLHWELKPETKLSIERASIQISALSNDCELKLLHFNHFGKGAIKMLKFHPDMFMQMAIQLAFYRMHATFNATYETGHTRAFFHGRTDTIRTLSIESVAFVEAMEDPVALPVEKLAKLKEACKAHGDQLQRVLTGQGIDRHLLGLYIAANLRGGAIPALFSDVAYKRSGGGGNYRISTSNVGYTPLCGGFAPMTPDGYGVCYAQLERRMNLAITTWRSCPETCADKFRTILATSLCDMYSMCTTANAEGGSKL
uniref:Choline/carnitine acyltransferase domain-containing protein n=1 Tax=Haptolina ericina TaxID=156174 RepID=A0A7S3BKK9_9EUKA